MNEWVWLGFGLNREKRGFAAVVLDWVLGLRLDLISGGGAEDRWLNVVDFWNPVYGVVG